MWESKQFWRETMYSALQTELVRIHTNVVEDGDVDLQKEQQYFRRRLTQLNEEDDMQNEYNGYDDDDDEPPPVQPTKKPGMHITTQCIPLLVICIDMTIFTCKIPFCV